MNEELVKFSGQEWERFWESYGSQYFRLESEVLKSHGDDQKKLLYELFGSTKILVQTIGVIAGFGFTGLDYVKNLPLFIGGEFFLFIAIFAGLFWTRQAYKSNLESSLAETKKIKVSFAVRFAALKPIYEKAMSDIETSMNISIPKSQIAKLHKANNEFLQEMVSEQGSNKSSTDPFGWLMLFFAIGGSLLLLSFVMVCHLYKVRLTVS